MGYYKVRYKGFLQPISMEFYTWSDAERWIRQVGKVDIAKIDKYDDDDILIATFTLSPVTQEIERGGY